MITPLRLSSDGLIWTDTVIELLSVEPKLGETVSHCSCYLACHGILALSENSIEPPSQGISKDSGMEISMLGCSSFLQDENKTITREKRKK